MVYIPSKSAIWLPLDERSGTIAYDKSGNNRNGTLTGAVWSQYHRGMLPGAQCVLWLPLDEGGGGKAYDFSGYGNNGEIVGAVWAKGPWGWELQFDRVDDVVWLGRNQAIFSWGLIEGWGCLTKSIVDYAEIVALHDGGVKRNYALGFRYPDRIHGRVSDGVTVFDVVGRSVSYYEYFYIAFALLEAKYILYVNGEKEAERDRTVEPWQAGNLSLGYAEPRYAGVNVVRAAIHRFISPPSEEEVAALVRLRWRYFKEEEHYETLFRA